MPSTSACMASQMFLCYWVAVKELKLSYYIGETLLFTMYTHYGNLISVPEQQPRLFACLLSLAAVLALVGDRLRAVEAARQAQQLRRGFTGTVRRLSVPHYVVCSVVQRS